VGWLKKSINNINGAKPSFRLVKSLGFPVQDQGGHTGKAYEESSHCISTLDY
jgi:hypothetical protein